MSPEEKEEKIEHIEYIADPLEEQVEENVASLNGASSRSTLGCAECV
jgi:hypothetical protein